MFDSRFGSRKTKTTLPATPEDVLDKWRKHRLWLSLNLGGIIAIVVFVLLAASRLYGDIRGEYTENNARLGVVRMSIEHRDKNLICDLIIPRTHPLRSVMPDTNIGRKVDWSFADQYATNGMPSVVFHGTAESGTVSGILQDSLAVYPINLRRDDLVSLFIQLRAAVPGAD